MFPVMFWLVVGAKARLPGGSRCWWTDCSGAGCLVGFLADVTGKPSTSFLRADHLGLLHLLAGGHFTN